MSTCHLMGSVPMYGGSPSFISKAMMPRDQMSTLYSCICIFVCIFVQFQGYDAKSSEVHLGVICLLVHNLGRKIRSKVDLCRNCCFRPSVLKEMLIVVFVFCLSGLSSLLTSGAIQYGVPAIVILFSPASIFDAKIRFSDFRNQNQDQNQDQN